VGTRSSPLEGLGTVINDQLDKTFWADRSVFLTGHTGFKGSWLSLLLSELGTVVHGYALAPASEPALFTMAKIEDCLATSTIGDIRDYKALNASLKSVSPEVVIHMAAQPLVRQSYLDPLTTFSTNVMGTVNLLEAARNVSSIKAIVIVTTDKVYENQNSVWGYRESDKLGGFDPYSSSKACTEIATTAYRQSFFNHDKYEQHGVAIATARAGNVIGGGDFSTDRLVPDIFRAFAAKQPILIRNPRAVRPWQHVLEPLRGYLVLAKALYEQGANIHPSVNFGPKVCDALTVEEIVRMLVGDWQHAPGWEIQPGEHPYESHALTLDITLASDQLGWHPQIGIEHALAYCCDWQRSICAGTHPRDVTLSQISSYLGKVRSS
jgi:CDP-glucose 4,6-dehydratase